MIYIYRQPVSDPPPHAPPPLSSLSISQSACVSPVQFTAGREGKGGGRGAQSNGREKAWPSRNHSILSALQPVERRIYTFYSRYHCSFNTFFTGNIKGKLHFYSKRGIAKQLCIFTAAFFSISLWWRECWNRGTGNAFISACECPDAILNSSIFICSVVS